jgi:hypothetical protein
MNSKPVTKIHLSDVAGALVCREQHSIRPTNGNYRLRSATQLVECLEQRVFLSSTITLTDSTSTDVPLVGVHAGDTITVQATLTTASDPNENGEGEVLAFRSSGGFSTGISTYNQPVGFSFKATQDGEKLTATATGNDADEYATATADFASSPTHWFKPTTKDALTKLRAIYSFGAVTAGAVGLGAGAASPVSAGAYAIAAEWGILSGICDLIVTFDPPDPNYKTIIKPRTPSLPLIKANKEVSGAVTGALNGLQINGAKIVGFLGAADSTSNRADGALVAGDSKWQKRQMTALSRFDKMAGSLFAKEVGLLQKAAAALTKAHLNASVSSSDALSFESGVLSNGLPSAITTDLTRLGADAATINNVQQFMFVQDTEAAAGTFPNNLIDPTFLSDLKQAATALKKG